MSLIIPVRDGGTDFETCLRALSASDFEDFELIVVDDGSDDDSLEAASRHGARIFSTGGGEGPAAARNLGAGQARAEILLFLDADCAVHPDTLGRLAAALQDDPELAALVGSYDDEPAAPGLVSQFRNLLHHYVHQQAGPEIDTFWTGCGAIRRGDFEDLDGFDASRFPRSSIEDVDLGYRLHIRGGLIRLDRQSLVTHLKRWTLRSMVVSDVRDRGLPWSRLILERGWKARNLNLSSRGRASVVLVAVAGLSLAAAIVYPPAALGAVIGLAFLFFVQRDLYRFLLRHRGVAFLACATPLHILHLGCCGAAWLAGCLAQLRP